MDKKYYSQNAIIANNQLPGFHLSIDVLFHHQGMYKSHHHILVGPYNQNSVLEWNE